MPTFVGIDLGTTNSVVAHRNAYGRPEVIANRDGANITPSVIYFGNDPPAVGQEARELARLGESEIASFFKPHMGCPSTSSGSTAETYSATDLSALVLRRLKEDAEAQLGEAVDRAVITVPAYFGDAQRKATIEAGNAAGFDVLRIINEPTAATLAYGLNKTGNADETVLIYDLGGGTFDVTVARITPEDIAVLATAGDHDLGGKNWDDRIATFLAEQFAAETGFDPLDDPVALNEVLVRSEQAKWALSERTSTRITLQLGTQRQELRAVPRRVRGDDVPPHGPHPTADRGGPRARPRLTWQSLDGVLLVGGSTRMPMVRSYVTRDVRQAAADGRERRRGRRPRRGDPGGHRGRRADRRRPAQVHPVGRRACGRDRRLAGRPPGDRRDVAQPGDHRAQRRRIELRERRPDPPQHPDPRRATPGVYLHATHGGANTRLEVYLTQGESTEPLDCTILGKYVFTGIHATDAEVTVDVGLSYDANGVVQVQAVQRDTGHRLALQVEPVPDDLSWLGRPPEVGVVGEPERIRVFLLIDVSSSMIGEPLAEAQKAAREFLDRCDFTTMEVGLISFSSLVALQAAATSNVRRLHAAIHRLEAEGSTNLTDALEMARGAARATRTGGVTS